MDELRNRVDEILQEVRRLSQDLRPPMLDELDLTESLQWLTSDLKERQDINTFFQIQGAPRRLSFEIELVLFRIAQEALNNISKHSQATEAIVRMEFSPAKVKLIVSDNGQGFELPEDIGDFVHFGKLGLIGIQERTRLIGGTLTIQSQPGRGASITVELPA